MNAPPVRQEKAIWEEAKNSLQRAQNLLEQGAISKGEFDIAFASERAAEARHDAALNSVQEKIAMINTRETELALAKHNIAEATILAPLSGYIQSRLVAPGTYLAVGQPVATMVATDPLRYRGTLPERYAQRLKPGLSITLNLASLLNPITASITRVSPTLEDQSRVISFEADIANPDQAIRAGLFAEAEVVIAPEATTIAVPASAVDSFAGVQKVWKVVEDHAIEQEVLIGMKRNDHFEITSGLELGDEIIIDASKGKRAKVIRTETPNKNQLTPSNESNN
jgi:RND family efflux transporter MFP subunit